MLIVCLWVVLIVFGTWYSARYDFDYVEVLILDEDGSTNLWGFFVYCLFGWAWYVPYVLWILARRVTGAITRALKGVGELVVVTFVLLLFTLYSVFGYDFFEE